MTEHTLSDLAQAIGLPVVGDGSIKVSGVAEPASAGPADLAVAMKASYADDLREGHAKVAMLWQEADWQALGLQGAILAERPRVALARVTQQFQPAFDANAGIHSSAQIDPSADIGANAVIGAFVQIGPRAQIAQGARIASHVSIGADVRIGPDALLHAGTHIGARCLIGARLVAQAGAVVGADGFSFEPPQQGSVEAVRQTGAVTARNESGFLRIHSLAAVEIGDDVEIGANSTIDRGTLAPTRIGHGTKIDNQVQIAHNVQIGHTCLICAQVGIAGSTEIGDRVVLAGKVGIGDHIKVGSDVVCAGGTLVAGNIPSNSVMMGIPATDRKTAAAQIVALRRLPKLIDQVAQIRKKLGL